MPLTSKILSCGVQAFNHTYLDDGLLALDFQHLAGADLTVGQGERHNLVKHGIPHLVDNHQGAVDSRHRRVRCAQIGKSKH